MNRTINYFCNVGLRSVSTNSVKSAGATVVAPTQKDEYYKNLDANFDGNIKPAGWDDALPYSKIPGPKPLPLIGNAWRFFPLIGEFHNMEVSNMHKLFRKEYGDISILRGLPGIKEVVMVFKPEAFETLHRNEGVFPVRDALKAFTHYRTVVRKDVFQGVGGVITVHGMDWYNFRSKVNPILMQPRTAAQYVGSMDIIANDLLAHIKDLTKANSLGEMPEDFINYLYRWGLESISYIAIDRRLGCLDHDLKPDSEAQTIINSVLNMFYLYYKIEVLPSLWVLYKTNDWKKFVEVMDTMTNTFLKYIQQSVENIDKDQQTKKEHELSVFQRLLKLDKKVAMAMAIDMLTAGVDTTGRTSGAALYYLAKTPEAQEKLRQEMMKLLPNKDSPVTQEVLSNAPYLKAAIKETTRLAPIGVGNFRQAVRDIVLCGYQIPKGTNILTSNLELCHSNEYFPKAMEFIPERWLRTTEGELSHKNTHPFVFLPFGFGPRSCLGKRLANLELEVLVAKMVRNYTMEWPHEDMTFSSVPLYGVKSPLKLRLKELPN